jgi:DNA-binding transcriptional ArsR family regulator
MTTATPNLDPFRAVSDPTRRAILDLLEDGEKSAKELGSPFRISQPALSQHLRVLRNAGLVTTRRDGRFRYYRLEPARLKEVHDWVKHYRKFWTGRLDQLGRYLERNR